MCAEPTHQLADDKVRGKKAAIARTVAEMKTHALGGESYASKCFVCHSNCEAMAKETIVAIEKQFPHLRGSVRLCDIGTIIASIADPEQLRFSSSEMSGLKA